MINLFLNFKVDRGGITICHKLPILTFDNEEMLVYTTMRDIMNAFPKCSSAEQFKIVLLNKLISIRKILQERLKVEQLVPIGEDNSVERCTVNLHNLDWFLYFLEESISFTQLIQQVTIPAINEKALDFILHNPNLCKITSLSLEKDDYKQSIQWVN